jgi:uncharacterized membrane protein
MAPSGAMATFDIKLASGNRSTNGNAATKSGGTIGSGGSTRGGGAMASTSMRGPLPTFNLVVEFFHKL